jgi:hypothetical protein
VYYADTLAKSIATSLSILLSLCMSIVLFDFTLTTNVCSYRTHFSTYHLDTDTL